MTTTLRSLVAFENLSFWHKYGIVALFAGLLSLTSVQAQTISGTVFRDFNSNGQRNVSATFNEVGVGGVTVTAYNAAGASVATTTTSSLTATLGSYTLTVGNTNAYRVEFTNVQAADFDAFRGTGSATSVQFVSGGATGVNYGVIYSRDYCGTTNPSLVTSCYVFGNQTTGTNSTDPVVISFPYDAGSRTILTYPNIGDANPVNSLPSSNSAVYNTIYDTPSSHTLAVTAQRVGTTFGMAYSRLSKDLFTGAYFKKHTGFGPGRDNTINTTVDQGYYQSASLGNFVFADTNNNGIQDGGDTPLPDVTVTLFSNGTVVATTVTNVFGVYSFTGLTPGVLFSVSFNTPANYTASALNVEGNDDLDSDPVGGITAPITLTSGQNDTSVDAGYSPLLGSIGDFVFIDLNRNGRQDAGEFPNLSAGTYLVEFDRTTLPAGFSFSQNVDEPGVPDNLDSDADPVTGRTDRITIISSNPDLRDIRTVDAGLVADCPPAICVPVVVRRTP